MAAGRANLEHALNGVCEDRDCEIHYPMAIEDENQRLTAMAWFIAGGERMVEMVHEDLTNLLGERDYRLDFLRDNWMDQGGD